MTLEQTARGVQPIGGQPSVGLGFSASEALRFLELLGKDPAQTWLRFIKPTGGGGGADLQGISTQKQQALVGQRISDGLNAYAVIGNAAKATGRRGSVTDADVTQCPALFVEWDDGASIEDQQWRWLDLMLPEPTVMVATGGKSVHVYWVLSEPITPEHWRKLTTRLIAYCKADEACKNPGRLMRLPGSIYHDKKTGQPTGQCRIIATSEARYTASEIEGCLPREEEKKPVKAKARGLTEAPCVKGTQPSEAHHEKSGKPSEAPAVKKRMPSEAFKPRGIDEINAAAEYIPRRIGGEGTYIEDRNALCGCSAALAEAGHPSPDAAAIALLGHLWPSTEAAEQVLETTTTRKPAAFWAIARDNGYRFKDTSRDKSQQPPAPVKPKQLTFEERWQKLEAHAAELTTTTWPVMKALASMASKASELEIHRLGQRQLEQLLEQAQRRSRATAKPITGGSTFTIKPTPWAVEGIFRHGLNLLTGQSGAGKSRLVAACMASWLRGDATWLQRPMHGDDPRHRHALIIGTDQTLEDWHLTLGPVGLTQKLDATTVRTHDRLTLYGLESGVQLDADGLNVIRRWVDAHPGGMVLIDSLSACLPPGTDEDKSTAARPVHQLQEVLGDAWAILTHHNRKGAGKEGNIGIGAGRGSGAIDAAVSRVVGLGLIYRMENGQMVAQESDPRRELLSTKRGGKTEHLIVSSDGNGYWDLHGSAEALKAQERQQRVISNLTEAQSDVLAVVEAADGWITPRDVVEALGEEYDATNGKAATVRKLLKRLEVLGLVVSQRVGNERSYRAAEQPSQRELKLTSSTCSVIAAQGVSLAQQLAQPCSAKATEQPEQPEQPEPVEQGAEPTAEPPKTTAAEGLSKLSYPTRSGVQLTGSASPLLVGSGADAMGDDGDDPHWPKRQQAA